MLLKEMQAPNVNRHMILLLFENPNNYVTLLQDLPLLVSEKAWILRMQAKKEQICNLIKNI